MADLPATTKHAAAVARVTIGSALALCAYAVPVTSLVLPVATMLLERTVRRPTRLLEEALARDEVLDLSDEQAVAFVQMAERYLLAARQGEFDRNLRLLAAYLAAELKAEICEPGSFLDVARRVEGLTLTSLRAVALAGDWLARIEVPGGSKERNIAAPLLANPELFAAPLEPEEAVDAVADLSGRGLLYAVGTGWGGGAFYAPTQPLRILISRALDIAQAEAEAGRPAQAARPEPCRDCANSI